MEDRTPQQIVITLRPDSEEHTIVTVNRTHTHPLEGVPVFDYNVEVNTKEEGKIAADQFLSLISHAIGTIDTASKAYAIGSAIAKEVFPEEDDK